MMRLRGGKTIIKGLKDILLDLEDFAYLQANGDFIQTKKIKWKLKFFWEMIK